MRRVLLCFSVFAVRSVVNSLLGEFWAQIWRIGRIGDRMDEQVTVTRGKKRE